MLLVGLIFNDTFDLNLVCFLFDFGIYSGFVQSDVCFANRRKSVFVFKKKGRTSKERDAKRTNIWWNRVQIQPKTVHGTFWRRSGASWGTQGVPDRILGVKSWFVGPPLVPWWGPFFDVFQCKFYQIFLRFLDFCIHFSLNPARTMGFWRLFT